MKQCQRCKRYEDTGTIIQVYKFNDGSYGEMCNMCAWIKYYNMQNNLKIIINSPSFVQLNRAGDVRPTGSMCGANACPLLYDLNGRLPQEDL